MGKKINNVSYDSLIEEIKKDRIEFEQYFIQRKEYTGLWYQPVILPTYDELVNEKPKKKRKLISRLP